MTILARSLAGVLGVLAALHVWWAVRGATGGTAIPRRADGAPLFRPGRVTTLGVAVALALAAFLVLARGGLVAGPLPASWIHVGTWGVAVTFAARTIGDLRYVGLFRRVRDTPFARWDARLFTPLAFAIAVSSAVLATS